MYDNKYINHIVGIKNKSIFRTSLLSSSAVHVIVPLVRRSFWISDDRGGLYFVDFESLPRFVVGIERRHIVDEMLDGLSSSRIPCRH